MRVHSPNNPTTVKAIVTMENTTKVMDIGIEDDHYDYIGWYVNGNLEYDYMDYEERLDAYVHASDDGERFYTVIHVLDDQENEPELLSQDELLKKMTKNMVEAIEEFTQGDLPTEDLSFLRNIFKSPAFMYAKWLENDKDVDAAHHDVWLNMFKAPRAHEQEAMQEYIEEALGKIIES